MGLSLWDNTETVSKEAVHAEEESVNEKSPEEHSANETEECMTRWDSFLPLSANTILTINIYVGQVGKV